MENEIEVDVRMNDECKFFVIDALKKAKLNDLMKLDINYVRQLQLEFNQRVNESIDLNDLDISEFTVKSKYDEYEIPVFCFRPKNVRNDSPITLFVHGGGYSLGCTKSYIYSIGLTALETKTVWLSVDYRLCPENKYPIPVNDCFSVFEWVAANKAKFSSPNAKLGVCGDSAGGHLAAIISNEYSSSLDYQILIYPIVDISQKYPSELEFTKDCYFLTPEMMDFFKNNFLTDDLDVNTSELSPILKEDLSNLPKTLIVASELDPLVDHSKEYFNKLQANKVDSRLIIIDGAIHGIYSSPVQIKTNFYKVHSQLVKFLEQF